MLKLTSVSIRVFLGLALFCGGVIPRLSAQTVPDSLIGLWQHNLLASVNLSQTSYTHWEAGGSNSLSYIASVNGKSLLEQVMTSLGNTYKLTYGQARLGDLGLRKTDDEINLESVLTYKLGTHINPYGALSLITQFAPGFRYTDSTKTQISNFFDPGYLKQSVGIGYKPSKIFQTRLGAALREVFTSQFNAFADDPATPAIETQKIEGGLESVSELEMPLDDNVLFRSRLELFSPIKALAKIVMHGQGTIAAKVSKYISTELTGLFISDPMVSPYTQIKEGLSIGISYTLL
jgi:hypothetical protein